MVSAFQGSWILMCSDFPSKIHRNDESARSFMILQTILFEGGGAKTWYHIFQTYLVFDHCLLKTKPIKLKLVFQRLWSNRWRQYTFVHNSCRCLRPCIYESGFHWRIYVRSTWICTLWKNNYALIFGPSLPHSLDPSHCVHWRTHPPNS